MAIRTQDAVTWRDRRAADAMKSPGISKTDNKCQKQNYSKPNTLDFQNTCFILIGVHWALDLERSMAIVLPGSSCKIWVKGGLGPVGSRR